jgi:hypothetical protein
MQTIFIVYQRPPPFLGCQNWDHRAPSSVYDLQSDHTPQIVLVRARIASLGASKDEFEPSDA